MRTVIAALVVASLIALGSASSQTLLGNCAAGTVSVIITSGNVYCTPPTGVCTGHIDLSSGCVVPGLGG